MYLFTSTMSGCQLFIQQFLTVKNTTDTVRLTTSWQFQYRLSQS